MWLEEFRRLFSEAARSSTGRDQDLASVEREVKSHLVGREVTSEVVRTIEKSTKWTFNAWWKVSSASFRPVTLPDDCSDSDQRRKAICDLYEEFRHIELVSIVLRFVEPVHFGMMSPPVTRLLHLPPGESNEDSYFDYVELLDQFRQHPDITSKALRIADVDMALWSAAVFDEQSRDYQAIVTEMKADKMFQQVRLKNGLAGLQSSLGSSAQRMVLARVLLDLDLLSASVITARIFEETLNGIADVYKITLSNKKSERWRKLFKQINNRRDILHDFELEAGRMDDYWTYYRNGAVHPDNPLLSKREAREFLDFVETLSKRLSELRQVR